MSRGALIVGGGTGLGLASAQGLAGKGWRVFLTGRRDGVLADAAAALGEACAGHAPGDATDEADIARVVAAAAAALGRIDALVVSSGSSSVGSVETIEKAELLRVLSVNLLPLALVSRAALPHMGEGGAIVAIASVTGSVPHRERLAYCASKSGLIGMVRQMALDLAPRRVRVNAVSPSLVLTDLSRGSIAQAKDPAAELARRTGRHPLGRLGTTEEVGAMVAQLCSDEAGWVTGQDIVMDGGLSLTAAG